jgi:hypothetical protein
MQHTDVDRSLAVERYLLGEMSATEFEEFEEHIFLCRQCAEDVRSGAEFFDNARAVLKEGAEREAAEEPAPARRWWDRFTLPVLAPAFATVLLICLAGYQRLVVIPGLQAELAESRKPQAVDTFAIRALSRGAEQAIKAPARGHFVIYFDVATPSSSGYSCEFRDASGAVRFTVAAPPAPGGTVNLVLNGSELPRGEYTLVVTTRDATTKEVGRYPFKVE